MGQVKFIRADGHAEDPGGSAFVSGLLHGTFGGIGGKQDTYGSRCFPEGLFNEICPTDNPACPLAQPHIPEQFFGIGLVHSFCNDISGFGILNSEFSILLRFPWPAVRTRHR